MMIMVTIYLNAFQIDAMVLQICKVYLRTACGDTLDTYKGENYDVRIPNRY